MNFNELIRAIYDFIVQLVPFFRVAWTITILAAVVLLVLAFRLKKDPERKKSPWIVGGIGLLMLISSGTQLLFSLLP